MKHELETQVPLAPLHADADRNRVARRDRRPLTSRLLQVLLMDGFNLCLAIRIMDRVRTANPTVFGPR
jgi:hypothetical protein